jgi:soluble lytic murein transglycosylase-like protein
MRGRLSAFLAGAACLLILVPVMEARAAAGGDGDLERLLDAIARVESRSDPNAVGDHGRAAGTYQIHRRYWEDGTRILGVDWPYADARDPQKARQVVRAYLSHYGRGKSLLALARIHNGGPQGHEKRATLDYARRVEAALDSIAPAS